MRNEISEVELRKRICGVRFIVRLLFTATVMWLLGPRADTLRAQDQEGFLNSVGVPTYQTELPVESGYVKVVNGALHLEIPLGAFPQRGGHQFKASLVYDSNIWTPGGYPANIPAANSDGLVGEGLSLGGWRLVTSADAGVVDYFEDDVNTCNHQGVQEPGYAWYQAWTYTEADGTTHGFDMRTRQGLPNDCGNNQQWNLPVGDGFALDSTGFSIYSDSNYNITVRAPDGSLVYPKFEDANGNFYSSTLRDTAFGVYYAGDFPTSGSVTDSLGRVLLTVSLSGTTVYIDVLNSKGVTGRYTVTTAQIPVAFTGISNIITGIQSVQLPDGKSYSFLYDCKSGTTGNPACGTSSLRGYDGEIISMTLPTGGQIAYSYLINDFNGSYVNTSLHTRTTPDSATPWTYSLSWDPTTCQGALNSILPAGCLQSLTVIKPSGDTGVYTVTGEKYGGAWPTTASVYNGSASPSNLLATINQAWNFSNACVTTGHLNGGIQACGLGPIYVTKTSQTTTLPVSGAASVTQTSKFTWDGESNFNGVYTSVSLYGQQLSRQDWNFGNTSQTPDRTATYTYWSATHSAYLTANILHSVASKNVTNSNGATVAQTLYSYDGSALVSGSVVTNGITCPAVTNSANHDDTNYGTGNAVRGNLTQAQQFVSGSNYLAVSKTYDILGQMRASTDPALNTTNYCYADNFFKDAGDTTNPPPGDNPATATNAYLTTVIYPTANGVTLSDKHGYYWGIGQKALSTDPNNQTTYFHYYDPLNRTTSTKLPNNGWDYSVYTGETTVDTGIGITSMTLSASCTGTSGGCRHDQRNLDGLGRTSTQILVSDPDGSDTTLTTYDSNGRVHTLSNPYRSIPSPTDGTETFTYDGLDRKLTVTHADTQVAYTYYGATVSSYGGLSVQKCSSVGYPILTVDEAKHLQQTWTDGFGRLVEVDEPSASGSLSSGISTCYSYDLNNNLITVNQGSGSVMRSFTYDMVSRLTAASNPESGTINYYYTTTTSGTTPCSGEPSEVCLRVAPLENQAKGSTNTITTTYMYDALNRITQKTYTDGTPGAYFYYDQSAPWGFALTNYLGRRTVMGTYNGTSWIASSVFSYDPVGNVIQNTEAIGGLPIGSDALNIYYTYNLDSSTSSITYPTSRQLNYITSNAQRTTMAYDSSNTYAQGPPTSIGCPFGESNNMGWACYAPPGELNALQNGAKLLTTSFYNNRLQPCRFAVNTGTTAPSKCSDTSHFGDKFDVQYSFDLSSLGGSLCSLTYGSYTNNGNVASITNNISGMSGRSQEFCYDALNRITSAQTASTYSTNSQTCWAEAYGIDAFGNLSSITPITSNSNGSYVGCSQESGLSTTITSGTNQDTASCYDIAGNKAGANPGSCSPFPTTYTYDGENRLISYAPAGESYTYDADGKRVEKNSSSGGTLYWYDRTGNVLTETNTSGSGVDDYVFFGGKRIARVNSSGSVFYYFADQLGTSRVNVQDGTTPTLCYDADFYPYGGERNTPDPPYTDSCSQNYKFTGKERDLESGNDYFGARYYSSAIGRFLSPDWSAKVEPVPYSKLGDPQTLNLYSYVENNPLVGVDADGHACEGWLGDQNSSFCQRAREYGALSDFVQGTTTFFSAAEATSRFMADADAKILGVPVGEAFVSTQTANFLDSIGKDLEQLNKKLAAEIKSGSLSGPNLDALMVKTEQTEVQRLLDDLQKSNPDQYKNVVGEINKLFNSGVDEAASKLRPTDRAYSKVVDQVRQQQLGGHIDFSRQTDREAIGNALTQHLRQPGGNDVNGQ